MSREVCGICWCPYDEDTGACACAPVQPRGAMNKDEIIKMAREAGLYHFHDSEGQCTGITNARLVTEDRERDDDRLVEMLAPFAALVRAAERNAILQMSREQWFKTQADFEEAIKARGNT